ncbi:uncharacterized protein METZ01_LOCUS159558 [marine metagenome]|uniref:Uncharacterized protein n=1 Tax=marine metagenome TaxID=408172 RepID=A0A382AZA6_9ZZZZ
MKHLLLTTIAAVFLATTSFAGPIHDAARNGDLEVVQTQLNKGVDVDAKNTAMGDTPLHHAAANGHEEIVKLLIAKGADVNENVNWEGSTPLHYAETKEVVELLIAGGADVNAKKDDGLTPLHLAAAWGHKKVVELLITKGAGVNAKANDGKTPLDWAVAWDEPETADLLRKHGGKISEELKPSTTKAPDISIHSAAFKGNIEAVQQHLAAGTDVNTKDGSGSTPLHTASTWGRKEIAELLIAKGADVNAKDEDGWTPLLNATIDGHKEIIELLIEKGADVNAKTNDGDTPLDKNMIDDYDDISTFGAKEEINDLLRKHGGKHGTIHSAAQGDDIEAVKEFLAAGANVNAKNRGGQTPLDMAYGEIADLLRKHGGKTGEELKALMPRLVQHGRFAFSFDAKEGKVYEVQDSFNLLNWEVVKTYTGTGDSVRFDEARYHNPPELFYRVRVVE